MRPLDGFRAWLFLCAVFALHVADEALSGFLDLWNPTVRGIHARHSWAPIPEFSFPVWITLLSLAVLGFLILSYWVRRGTWWTPFAARIFGWLMLLNAVAHLAFSIYKGAWMAGSYTSPLLLIASIWLLYVYWATPAFT